VDDRLRDDGDHERRVVFVDGAREPWLLVVAYHSPHKPIHEPPEHLVTEPVAEGAPVVEKYRAMLEATDAELGRLLRSIDREVLARTTVVLTSDNGTSPPGADEDDLGRVKSTLYEGGVHVPLVFAGAGIGSPGARTDALVHVVDLLPTFAAWAGAPPATELDGVDIGALIDDPTLPGPVNVRTRWAPEGPIEEAARDDRYKLAFENGAERLHDLDADPDELVNLLDEEPWPLDVQAAYDRLQAALAAPTADARWGDR
jgi:arylsulfatase A-like enzyme